MEAEAEEEILEVDILEISEEDTEVMVEEDTVAWEEAPVVTVRI